MLSVREAVRDKLRIPVRATVASAFAFVPYLFIGIMVNVATKDRFLAGVAVEVCGACILVLRAPVTMSITFKVNSKERSNKSAEETPTRQSHIV